MFFRLRIAVVNKGVLINDTPTKPSSLADPLSINKAQSILVPTQAISNTLIITFTIKNERPPASMPEFDPTNTITETAELLANFDLANDPNTLHNVLLTDELLFPQATFANSSWPASQENNTLAWNLGTIPPLQTVTITLQLTIPPDVLDFTPLDNGATVWGTLQGRSVQDTTSPLMLTPSGFDGWLICTIDANCDDSYAAQQVDELGGDPLVIFQFVQSLNYESYKGSLRGARGTLWSQAGNALDKSSLLIAMLGIPASYRHGNLPTPLTQQLILSMFPEP